MEEVLALAREARLIVKELDDEVLVYDLETDKAHCLNSTAAGIWRNCNGSRTVAQLSELMERETNSRVPEEMVWLALDQLKAFQLLQTAPARPARLAVMNRRQLVRTIGIAALPLPVILSIVVPTPAQSSSSCVGSNRPDGCNCTNPSNCIPSHHCTGGICGP